MLEYTNSKERRDQEGSSWTSPNGVSPSDAGEHAVAPSGFGGPLIREKRMRRSIYISYLTVLHKYSQRPLLVNINDLKQRESACTPTAPGLCHKLSQNSAVPQKESGGISPTPPARAYSASLGEPSLPIRTSVAAESMV